MQATTDCAIVLRLQPVGDADVIVSVLSAEQGRIDAVARGARSSRKRFGGTLRPFCEIELQLQQPRVGSLMHMSAATLRRDLLGDAVSYPQLCIASYLLDMALQCSQPGHSDPPLYRWLRERLTTCGGASDNDLLPLKLSAEAALLHTMGVLPDLRHCARCHGGLDAGAHWPADSEGLGCGRCAQTSRDRVSGEGLRALARTLDDATLAAATAIAHSDRRLLHDRLGRKVALSFGQLRTAQALRELL